MNEQAQPEPREALLVILVALILVGASWFLLGNRATSNPPSPATPRVASEP